MSLLFAQSTLQPSVSAVQLRDALIGANAADTAVIVYSQRSQLARSLGCAMERFTDLQVVLLERESPGAMPIRRDNPWIDDDPQQSYLVLYRAGLRVEGFPVRSIVHALDRLDTRGVGAPRSLIPSQSQVLDAAA